MPNLTLAQFNQYIAGTPAAFSIDPFTGISGTSVQHIFGSDLTRSRIAIPATATGVPKGIRVGQFSVALKRSLMTPNGGLVGISFGHSHESTSGACYSVEWYRRDDTANRIRLTRHASGGIMQLGATLGYAEFAETLGPITVRVAWDLTTGVLEVWRGTALDYSDLASIITAVDPVPLGSPVAEGFFVTNYGLLGTPTYTVWLDNLLVETFD